ncbi:MAG: response regulator transcription factor [Pseudomonadota bacterium]
MRVLVLEDDKTAREAIVDALQSLDASFELTTTLADALAHVQDPAIRIVIADRMLPDGDGLDLVSKFRAANEGIQIMVVSALGRAENRVEGLITGADDYLTKPFDQMELRARIAALLRRADLTSKMDDVVAIGPMEIRRKARTVHIAGEHTALSPKEFDLLLYLAENQGEVVTRSMLLEKVWGMHFDPQTNVVDVHIGRLRTKIDGTPSGQFLMTIRGKGYVLDTPHCGNQE